MQNKSLNAFAIFAVFGAIGSIVSSEISLQTSASVNSENGLFFELLIWCLFPARLFGMGLGDFGKWQWIIIGVLNTCVFGGVGLLIAQAFNSRFIVSVVYFLFIVTLLFLYTWFAGFLFSIEGAFAIICALAFYSMPFVIIATTYINTRSQPKNLP